MLNLKIMAAYFEISIAFLISVFAFESYLDFRQRKKYFDEKPPTELQGIIDQRTFEKAQAYNLEKMNFGIFKGLIDLAQSLAVLLYFVLPSFWKISLKFIQRWGYSAEYETVHSIVFLVMLTAINIVISLPFDLYSIFVIEERHGFNKQTIGLFFKDMVKKLVLMAVLGFPLIALFIRVIRWGGDKFYLYAWAFMMAVTIIFMVIYPTFIQPLFNKLTPLPENPLRKKIEALAQQLKFPLHKLYVIDGSKRSSHSNAYFYGLFQKHIVLYDTLIEKNTNDQIVAILGHELGHWKFSHMWKRLGFASVHMFVTFYVFGRFMNDASLYESFGFSVGKQSYTMPIVIGLTLFQMVISPIEAVIGFISNLWSRYHEFEADRFSCSLGHGKYLRDALISLHKENLSTPNPDTWYSAFHYSHPPLLERLRAIDAAIKKGKK